MFFLYSEHPNFACLERSNDQPLISSVYESNVHSEARESIYREQLSKPNIKPTYFFRSRWHLAQPRPNRLSLRNTTSISTLVRHFIPNSFALRRVGNGSKGRRGRRSKRLGMSALVPMFLSAVILIKGQVELELGAPRMTRSSLQYCSALKTSTWGQKRRRRA